MSFWIADGEFSGQAAEDLAAIYDEQNDQDYSPDEQSGEERSEAGLYEQEFTDPFTGETR